MDLLGVGRRSSSSGFPLSEDRELFFFKPGEEEGRWFKLIALDVRRTLLAGLGECGAAGEVAGCEGRRGDGTPGVAGVEESGVRSPLLEACLVASLAIVWVACACSVLRDKLPPGTTEAPRCAISTTKTPMVASSSLTESAELVVGLNFRRLLLKHSSCSVTSSGIAQRVVPGGQSSDRPVGCACSNACHLPPCILPGRYPKCTRTPRCNHDVYKARSLETKTSTTSELVRVAHNMEETMSLMSMLISNASIFVDIASCCRMARRAGFEIQYACTS
jgi:hypothetical protein